MIWINRECSDRIVAAARTRPAVLLTGMRQAGKSSLLKHLFPDAVYVTLDDIMMAREANENPEFFLNRFSGEKRVVIDEIQYAPGLLRDLKIRIDSERQLRGKWILTGSQRFSLMSQAGESLAGRISVLELPTLSAQELLGEKIAFSLDDLIKRGGFPELWKERGLDADQFYSDYLKTYIERDVRSILKIGDLYAFQRLLQLLACRSARMLNFSELAKDASVAPNTVKTWVSVLEASGMIVTLPPYFESPGKRMIKAPKFFFSDTGLLLHILRPGRSSPIREMPIIGQIWENFVLSELIKTVPEQPGRGIYYYRDSNGVELDALLIRDNRVFALEAKSAERPDEKKLNFRKVMPLFEQKGYQTRSIVAAPVVHGRIEMERYAFINPGLERLISG